MAILTKEAEMWLQLLAVLYQPKLSSNTIDSIRSELKPKHGKGKAEFEREKNRIINEIKKISTNNKNTEKDSKLMNECLARNTEIEMLKLELILKILASKENSQRSNYELSEMEITKSLL